MQRVEAEVAVSVSALKQSPSKVMDEADGAPVAILNHNRVMAYMLSADVYEAILDQLDDQYLARIAKERKEKGEKTVRARIEGDDVVFADDDAD